MAGTEDRTVIVDRYNHACSSYQSATAALKRGSAEQYEAGLVDAAQAVWSALEWAVRFHLEHDFIQQLDEEDKKKLKTTNFVAWVDLLGKVNPPVDEMTRRQLVQHRRLRNENTHDGVIPSQRTVLAALANVRRFLVQRLLVPAEQLLVAVTDEPQPAPQPAQAPALELPEPPGPEPAFGEHRKVGLNAWLEQTLARGIAQARSQRGERYDATLDSLALEAKRILTRDAIALCLAGRDPDAPLVASEASIEEEIQRLLFGGPAAGLDAAGLTRLRHLVPLLQRRTSLCVEAKWLKQEGEHVAFASPSLAVILAGAAIAAGVSEVPALRPLVGARLGWTEAGWAAVTAGDRIEPWASLLLETPPSPAFLSRVVATAAAFGAAPANITPTDTVLQAFRLCVLTLIWFSPVRTDAFGKVIGRGSPWYLPAGTWRRAILDLAHIASLFRQDRSLLLDASSIAQPPEPLNTIIRSLEIERRLSDEQVASVLVACAPYQAANVGRIDERLFGAVFDGNTWLLSAPDFVGFWLKSYGIPALWSTDRMHAARLLAQPGQTRPAGFLLNYAELHPEWSEAWREFTKQATPSEIVAAWCEAVGFVSRRHDETTLELVRSGFCLLDSMGLGEELQPKLRSSLKPVHSDPKEPSCQMLVQIEILRRALPTPSEFTATIERWTEEPALAWRTLLAAGAPDEAIARWCMTKLAEHAKVPHGYQSGPVGVISSAGMEPLRTGPWQLAFKQAREALEWLLEHGSSTALSVIADICTPSEGSPATVDPIMGKMSVVNLSVPLSQVIWGRVVVRPEGRAALYSLVESGKAPSALQFLPVEPFQGHETNLWFHTADALGKLREQLPPNEAEGRNQEPSSDHQPAAQIREEAERLLACFERRLLVKPGLAWLNGQPVRAGIAAMMATCGADVSTPLSALLDELTKDPAPESGRSHACLPIGMALLQLATHHTDRAKLILERAFDPRLFEIMRRDDTSAFWIALFAYHGTQRVLGELGKLGWRDLRLGVFDALRLVDERTLIEWHVRPAMMRPALLRAIRQEFVPTATFWNVAWATERGPEDVPELIFLLDGLWLTQLLEKSDAWSSSARIKLLRHLAMYAVTDKVRERCLTALSTMERPEG